ncbi:MAG: caspase family protein [Candidatus Aminicenantes bacterium]|jgi:hypothetical protein
MRKTTLFIIIGLLVFNFYLSGSDQEDQTVNQAVVKRFVVAVGANNGGEKREELQYALSDAKSFLRVFHDLGGVTEEDSLFLAEPDAKSFFTELDRFQAKIEKARPDYSRLEFFFYYSGHSDDKNILLGDEMVSYEDLRETISGIDADVRIAILDSCASGAFTRIKGGKKRQPFLLDTAYDMKGYAYLSSSSANEVSQESDLIKGSFFTHYLVSGLRGAADVTQDSRVTLNEAYQFAFNETLTQTTKTLSGPQHPNTHIQMSGTGDVVMTDIRRGSAVLVLLPDILGNIFIHDQNDLLVVEMTKPIGRRIELGLDEGSYRIINIVEGQVYESKVVLRKGKEYALDVGEFVETEKMYTTPRGDREMKIRETIWKEKLRLGLFVECGTKSTKIYGDRGILLGLQAGININRSFSIGAGLFGRAYADLGALDIDIDFKTGKPAYGGLYFAYTALPERRLHLQTGALFGFGSAWGTDFFVVEPGVAAIFNITRFFRFKVGVSWAITDKKVGLDKRIWTFSLQLGI